MTRGPEIKVSFDKKLMEVGRIPDGDRSLAGE